MKRIIIVALCVLSILFVNSCSKKDPANTNGKLQFSVAIKSNSSLKAAVALPAASYILVSIETSDGKSVYESEKIELYNFDGSYLSKTISISPGNFVLTKFLVLDNTGNAIYATPKKDSPKAYLVKNPLDINFTISADVVTKLSPEVLSTATSTPDAFGYFDATFQIVKTFDFLVSVFVYDEASKNFQLTNASITIADSLKDLYTLALDAKTNMVTVNDGLPNYKITISKPGYEIYSAVFAQDSLKAKFSFPLIVNLTKSSVDLTTGLVAYYPFNGNANDESGNGNNGTEFNIKYDIDRFENPSSSAKFNGDSSYVLLNNPFDYPQRTISFWFNTHSNPSEYFNLYSSDNPNLKNGGINILLTLVNSELNLIYSISKTSYYTKINLNGWYHLVMVVDNLDMYFYLNGTLISNMKALNNVVSDQGVQSAVLGTSRLLNNRFFDGLIDDVYIFNRSLNDKEVYALYNYHSK
jgi:hypothetical protein